MNKKLSYILILAIAINVLYFIMQIKEEGTASVVSGDSQLSNAQSEANSKFVEATQAKIKISKISGNQKEDIALGSEFEVGKDEEQTNSQNQKPFSLELQPEEEKAFGQFFKNSKNLSDFFSSDEYDPEWAPKITNAIYESIDINPDTGEKRFPNLNLNSVDCRSSSCKLSVEMLGTQEEKMILLRDVQLALLEINNKPDNMLVNRMVHRAPNGDIYVSRGVND